MVVPVLVEDVVELDALVVLDVVVSGVVLEIKASPVVPTVTFGHTIADRQGTAPSLNEQ